MNHILINATHKEEIRVAIVRSQKLTDLNIETSLNRKTKGNIYKARISRVEQSLEAAFVDYGKEKHGFLPFKEVSSFFANGIKSKGEKLNMLDRIALKRQGSTEDIAEAVLFLADAKYITGQVINIDGGRSLNQ